MLGVASGVDVTIPMSFVPVPTVAITLVGPYSALGEHWRVFVYLGEDEYYHDSANSKKRATDLADNFIEREYLGRYLQKKAEREKRLAGGNNG